MTSSGFFSQTSSLVFILFSPLFRQAGGGLIDYLAIFQTEFRPLSISTGLTRIFIPFIFSSFSNLDSLTRIFLEGIYIVILTCTIGVLFDYLGSTLYGASPVHGSAACTHPYTEVYLPLNHNCLLK